MMTYGGRWARLWHPPSYCACHPRIPYGVVKAHYRRGMSRHLFEAAILRRMNWQMKHSDGIVGMWNEVKRRSGIYNHGMKADPTILVTSLSGAAVIDDLTLMKLLSRT